MSFMDNNHGGKRRGAGRKRAVKVRTVSAIVSCGHCGHSAPVDKVANGQDVICRQCGRVGIVPARSTVARLTIGDAKEIEL